MMDDEGQNSNVQQTQHKNARGIWMADSVQAEG